MDNKKISLNILLYIEEELEKIIESNIEKLNNFLKQAIYLSEEKTNNRNELIMLINEISNLIYNLTAIDYEFISYIKGLDDNKKLKIIEKIIEIYRYLIEPHFSLKLKSDNVWYFFLLNSKRPEFIFKNNDFYTVKIYLNIKNLAINAINNEYNFQEIIDKLMNYLNVWGKKGFINNFKIFKENFIHYFVTGKDNIIIYLIETSSLNLIINNIQNLGIKFRIGVDKYIVRNGKIVAIFSFDQIVAYEIANYLVKEKVKSIDLNHLLELYYQFRDEIIKEVLSQKN